MRRTYAFLVLPLLIACSRPTPLTPEAEAGLAELELEGDLITAKKIREIPLDPNGAAWNESEERVIPLVSQISVVPRAPVFQRMKLAVRVLYNDQEIGLRLSWEDSTEDGIESGSELFRDAVAVGFPQNFGDGAPLPYIGMGNKGRPMNIWHWKASWQIDVDRGYQGIAERIPAGVRDQEKIRHFSGEEAGNPLSNHQRKTPTENLLSEGFGTLTSVPDDSLNGKGVWENKGWTVVLKRKLSFDKKKGGIPVTFAVWDGNATERNGMKGLARWRFLRLEGENPTAGALAPLTWKPSSDPKRGKQLVTDLGCAQCHNLPGAAAVRDVGPDLTHVGSIHRASYLYESIKEPNAVIVPAPGYFDPQSGTSTMPSYGDALAEQDYHDIVAYLRGLQ